jgi:acetyl-CoA synthetase
LVLQTIFQVVFAGFSADALAGRILDCQAEALLTCSGGQSGNKLLPLKRIVDEALQLCIDRANFQPGKTLIFVCCQQNNSCNGTEILAGRRI